MKIKTLVFKVDFQAAAVKTFKDIFHHKIENYFINMSQYFLSQLSNILIPFQQSSLSN